ncbi:MAG: hypothetical protein EZS28_011242 [Streblomastix strix]|uniref:Uncharacterized protein n=1 Tax=Streblomastix strix TaxID=222440 RepID=A0A5J4WEU8_9EUKA|nr:MAG: hypothetical protein EZS28_011242 [Streblomastix strix]
MDYSTGVAYRAIVEPLAPNALSVRYLFGKKINISVSGGQLQHRTINLLIIICSLPALTTYEWTDIYAAVGRAGFYGQFIAEVVGEYATVEHIGVASPWKFRFIRWLK